MSTTLEVTLLAAIRAHLVLTLLIAGLPHSWTGNHSVEITDVEI